MLLQLKKLQIGAVAESATTSALHTLVASEVKLVGEEASSAASAHLVSAAADSSSVTAVSVDVHVDSPESAHEAGTSSGAVATCSAFDPDLVASSTALEAQSSLLAGICFLPIGVEVEVVGTGTASAIVLSDDAGHEHRP